MPKLEVYQVCAVDTAVGEGVTVGVDVTGATGALSAASNGATALLGSADAAWPVTDPSEASALPRVTRPSSSPNAESSVREKLDRISGTAPR